MEWLDIPGLDGKFQVSNTGCIRNSKTGTILKLHTNSNGRIVVNVKPLGRKGPGKTLNVHRCVALAFLERNDETHEVNHIDGNPSNNNVSNLEWVSHAENMQHAVTTGLRTYKNGEDVVNSKLTNEQVNEIRLLSKDFSNRKLAKMYSVSHVTINYIINNKSYRSSSSVG